jgi:NADPH:quinone reductase-like Zn-dependent oxidoreductase
VKPYHSVLVTGAGSGVGVMAILLLKAMGIEPICAVGSEWKIEKLASLGFTKFINYQKEKLPEAMKRFSPDGVDIVIEHIGGAILADAFRCLKRGGIIVTCGATAGDPPSFNLRYCFVRQLKFAGSYMGSLNEFSLGLKIVQTHKIKPVIDSVFDLQEGKLAHKKMQERNLFGKILLKVS